MLTKITLFDSDGDNTAQAAKAAPGSLHHLEVSGIDAVDSFFQIFDLLAADVTVGTTTPKLSYLVPAGNATVRGVVSLDFGESGLRFDTGITYACTTTATGNTDPTTGLNVNLVMS